MRQIAVIGLGKFGDSVARELTEKGARVIAIDKNKERVEDLKDLVAYAAALDTVDKDALKSVGIQDIDIAVVCIGDDIEANLLTTLLLKKLGVRKIWSRAISPLQQEILKALEVDEIINLEEEMGKIVARSLVSTSITKHIPLSSGHSIAEIKIPHSFIGKSIREINPREKFNINIVAIKKKIPQINELGERTFGELIEDVPSPNEPLEEEDILLVVGTDENIRKFSERQI
ncbi:MAG: TrkA family potassium uptake protein [Candidatus Omnitrophota bacterium]